MHSPNEGAFFCILFVQFCGKSWLFWVKIARLQCGCQLVGQNSVFLTHVLRFSRVFPHKIGAKVVQKCSQNVFENTQNQQENGRKSMCKKRCKFAGYSHLEIQQNSVQIGAYQQCKTCAKVVQKCSQNVFALTQNQSKDYSKNPCKTGKKMQKEKSRNFSTFLLLC